MIPHVNLGAHSKKLTYYQSPNIKNMSTNEIKYSYTAFEVKGDSMDDGTRESFEAGDKLLVIPAEDFRTAISSDLDSFWVIETENRILLKQIIEYNKLSDTVTCHSLNPSPAFLDFEIPIKKIEKIYRVIQQQRKVVRYGNY